MREPGKLGSSILNGLLQSYPEDLPFTDFIACVRSEKSKKALEDRFGKYKEHLSIRTAGTDQPFKAHVIILAVDRSDVQTALTPHLLNTPVDKTLISVVAGWTQKDLVRLLQGPNYGNSNWPHKPRIIRALPNIAAAVSQSMTAIEVPTEQRASSWDLDLAESIFKTMGRTMRIPPNLTNAVVAVGGSTPAFFAVLCEAFIDAAFAVGVPRDIAQTMISQSMLGTATMLQNGMHTGMLKDEGTSSEGCTIGGLMVMEESGVRGHLGRALREAVTISRLMQTEDHVNDTRH